jgi:hypothetical protein
MNSFAVRPELVLSDVPRTFVRPELVEGLSFHLRRREGQGFDELSPNGVQA